MSLNIIPVWDSSVEALGTQQKTDFKNAVNTAIQFFTGNFTDNVTLKIEFGWGGIQGHPELTLTDPSAFGAAANVQDYQLVGPGQHYSYTDLRQHLANDEPANVFNLNAALPVNDPSFGGWYKLTSAQAKALGMDADQNSGDLDGWVVLNSGLNPYWSYSNNPSKPQIDAVGAFEHEISEVMGRIGYAGQGLLFGPMDLFRYNGYGHAGQPDVSSGVGYFSPDGQNLFTQFHNPLNGQGDPADWETGTQATGGNLIPGDPFGGVESKPARMTETDLRAMDVIGWDRAASSTPTNSSIYMQPRPLDVVANTGVYRVDLGASGFSTIQSITIHDDNFVSGGTGGASGLDLDFALLSTTATSSASTAAALLPGLNALDFSSANVTFQPGNMQPWNFGDNSSWNTTTLFGTTAGNQYSQALASLNTRDGLQSDPGGAISLGEGGSITFTLKQPVSTQGLYLYFGDAGAVGTANDGCYVLLNTTAGPSLPSGITLIGDNNNNDFHLGVGTNVQLGAGDDFLSGAAGKDKLGGAAGHDTLTGGADADQFFFDLNALPDAQASIPIFDRITDYDHGNSGSYNASEGDQIDCSAILASAYNHGFGQSVSSLVQLVEDDGGGFAGLQVDPDGAANGLNWLTIAQLDGLQVGNNVNIVLDGTLPTGSIVSVKATSNPFQVVLKPGPEGQDLWITNIFNYSDDYGIDNSQLKVGGWGDVYDSLIKFDLNDISSSHVSSATLRLYNLADLGGTPTGMSVEQLQHSWDESYGWYGFGTRPENGGISTADPPNLPFTHLSTVGAPGTGWIAIDVTAAVNAWLSNPGSNNGLLLRPLSTNDNFNDFVSSDASGANAQFHPELVVTLDTPANAIVGDAGDNSLLGTPSDDTILGLGGNDTIFAGGGRDTLDGGDGNDTLIGNADPFVSEPDTFIGGSGNDTLYVEASDSINGGPGHDLVYVVNSNPITINLGATSVEWIQSDFGNDTIDASTQTVGVEIYSDGGNDTITGSAFDDIIWSGSGNDTVTGGDGNDVIVGDVGADSISGGNGNDSLYIDASDTFIDGGGGFDAAYITAGSGMSINLATTHLEWVADFAGGNDTLNGSGLTVNMETYAAAGNDTVIGGSGNDFLWGEAGNDIVTGNAGNDTLVGGLGADTLTGGPGTDALYGNSGNGGDGAVDTFVFTDNWGTDFVFDFEHGVDKLDMRGVTGLHAFSDFIVTNTPDGHCYLTFNGNLVAIANHTSANVTASDFLF